MAIELKKGCPKNGNCPAAIDGTSTVKTKSMQIPGDKFLEILEAMKKHVSFEVDFSYKNTILINVKDKGKNKVIYAKRIEVLGNEIKDSFLSNPNKDASIKMAIFLLENSEYMITEKI